MQGSNANEYEEMLADFVSRGGAFKELQDISDESMEAIYGVAHSLYEGGKYDDAIKVFQFLGFYDTSCKKYFLGLGACLYLQEEYDRAIEVFGYLCALDTSDPQGMLYIGDCHLADDEPGAARIAYQAAVEWAGDQEEWKAEKERAQNMLNHIVTDDDDEE